MPSVWTPYAEKTNDIALLRAQKNETGAVLKQIAIDTEGMSEAYKDLYTNQVLVNEAMKVHITATQKITDLNAETATLQDQYDKLI